MRRILAVTTNRADFGILSPVLAALRDRPALEPGFIVSGGHVPAERPVAENDRAAEALAREAGVRLAAMVPMPLGEGDALDTALGAAAVTAGVARHLSATPPDMLLVIGDRMEMHAAALAASALRIPVAHVHGGEESEGAIDNLFRHSMTKLSHLHFCATDLSARRLFAMGEDPWRVRVTGAPALDGLAQLPAIDRDSLGASLAIPPGPFALATLHPETLSPEASLPALQAILDALDEEEITVVFTGANTDAGGRAIDAALAERARTMERLRLISSLGRARYFAAMRHAAFMIGNSSSGIIEAASFGLPVVNVGDRQAGRERSDNVLDAAADRDALRRAIRTVRGEAFRARAAGAVNVYGRGQAGAAIAEGLIAAPDRETLLRKAFRLPG